MAESRSRWLQTLAELAGAATPLAVRDLRSEISDKLQKVPTRLNEFGYDAWGMRPADLVDQLMLSGVLHRWYFRVETHDIERVPDGRVLLICNHAGQLPFDAMMLGMTMLLEANPPRVARGMGEYFIPRLPFLNVAAARGGQMVGTPENCAQLLEADECVMVFPEGVRGMNKLYRDRYRLMRMGLGFVRLALETNTPIVPVAVVGSEEQNPGFANLRSLARPLGLPALPVTALFPWLGPLGLLPLPVKYRIHFGEPIWFEGSANEDDAAIEERVDRVKGAIEQLLASGRAARSGVFS
ncbi:MAG: acyltransferase family protein [Myxococcales bacterium]|nr:acyltransferase family protein [Myxococcales bacterium]